MRDRHIRDIFTGIANLVSDMAKDDDRDQRLIQSMKIRTLLDDAGIAVTELKREYRKRKRKKV